MALAALLVPACQQGPGRRPMIDRQDPARFESCADPDGQARYDQALVDLQAGRDAEALPQLRRVVEVCPELVRAHAYYQDTAMALGGEAEAEMRAYYGALPDDSGSPVPAYVKARLLQSAYARKQAMDELLQRHGDFAYAYLSLGRLNRGIGRFADAALAFQRAIDRYPGLLEAHLELAEVLVEAGRHGEALRPYRNYLAGAPNDRSTIRALVHVLLYKLGMPAEARPWIEQLLEADPLDEQARMDLAACEWLSGDLESALATYLEVLERRPDYARAALNIGHLHYDAMVRDDDDRRDHWPLARKAYRLFLQLVRPEEGYDHFEARLAVPYRLKEIDAFLGPADPQQPVSIDELRSAQSG